MFSPNTVYFGKGRKAIVDCQSRGQAELVVRLANLGVSGEVKMPADSGPVHQVAGSGESAHGEGRARFKELAESRTGDERIRQQLMEVLERWFVLGRITTKFCVMLEADAADEDA